MPGDERQSARNAEECKQHVAIRRTPDSIGHNSNTRLIHVIPRSKGHGPFATFEPEDEANPEDEQEMMLITRRITVQDQNMAWGSESERGTAAREKVD